MSDSDDVSTPHGPSRLSPDMALDERLYDLSDEESSFFKQQTGIQDDDELKAHIIQVQASAYKVCNREARQSQDGNSCLGLSQNRFILTLASASSILQSESWGEGTWRQLKSDNSPRLKMWRLSPYQDLLKIGKSRGGAIFLDIGSCGKNHHLSISLKIVTYFS